MEPDTAQPELVQGKAFVQGEGEAGKWETRECQIVDITAKQLVAPEALFDEGRIYRYQTERGNTTLSFYQINSLCQGLTRNDALEIAQTCVVNGLNPWLDIAVWKTGAKLAIHIKDVAFMRRADNHLEYNGFEAGWILSKSGSGRVCIPAGGDIAQGLQIVGAWCKVHREGRVTPVAEAMIDDYKRTSESKRGIWDTSPTTMIAKVARHQAHRLAFPDKLAGLYSDTEMATVKHDDAKELPEGEPDKKQLTEEIASAFDGQTADNTGGLGPDGNDAAVTQPQVPPVPTPTMLW